jgi:hypothetical protein
MVPAKSNKCLLVLLKIASARDYTQLAKKNQSSMQLKTSKVKLFIKQNKSNTRLKNDLIKSLIK